MPKKKKKKCRGKAQKKKLRRKQWHAQSRGAPFKGQDKEQETPSSSPPFMVDLEQRG